jgi:hypothetical protein
MRALGPIGAILLGLPALVIAVPWLVTLYLVQAFASRIAVLEDRHALDAIGSDFDELIAILEPWGAAIRAGRGYPANGPHDLAEKGRKA